MNIGQKLVLEIKAFFEPQSLVRLEFIRIFIPLAILGFLSSRLIHPSDWLSIEGFQIPNLGHSDWRQPFYIPPLPIMGAVGICILTPFSGLFTSLGLFTKISSGTFSFCLIYLALADRLAAFTVSKLGAVLILALFLTPAGNTFSLDALLNLKKISFPRESIRITWGNIRFFQILIVVLYMASGIAKIHGDWLTQNHVLWSHLHDSYQTATSYWIAHFLPYSSWTFLQYLVLIFEIGAPLFFFFPQTRIVALVIGLGMHLFIALAFGPVIWFGILMIFLLMGCFSPQNLLLNIMTLIFRKP